MSRLGGTGSVNLVAPKTGLKRQAVFQLVISFLNSGNSISENTGKKGTHASNGFPELATPATNFPQRLIGTHELANKGVTSLQQRNME